VTDPSRIILHEVYNYLCYVPSIAGAYWYGALGGVAGSAGPAGPFIPHIRSAWAGNGAYSTSLYAQVLAFHLLGPVRCTRPHLRTTTTHHTISRRGVVAEANEPRIARVTRSAAAGGPVVGRWNDAAGLAQELLAGVTGALAIIAPMLHRSGQSHRFCSAVLRFREHSNGLFKHRLKRRKLTQNMLQNRQYERRCSNRPPAAV